MTESEKRVGRSPTAKNASNHDGFSPTLDMASWEGYK